MPFEIWYDLGVPNQTDASKPFEQWRLFTPLPRTAREAGAAVESLLSAVDPLLITINKVRETKSRYENAPVRTRKPARGR